MSAAFRNDVRSTVPELMDTEHVPYGEFARCLRDIARINAATRGHAPTLSWLRRLWASRRGDGLPFRILDVGFGYGDALRAIASEARRLGTPVELTGIDINPWAKQAAESATAAAHAIRFETADLFAWNGGPYDAVVSSLFAHHLDDERLIAFVRWMHGNARCGWFVNDLHRHVVPYAFIAGATRAFALHRFVRNDAPLSVARAFRRGDWDALLARAELSGERAPRVHWEALFRYCVAWER